MYFHSAIGDLTFGDLYGQICVKIDQFCLPENKNIVSSNNLVFIWGDIVPKL